MIFRCSSRSHRRCCWKRLRQSTVRGWILKESQRNPTSNTPRARATSKAKARCSDTDSFGLQASRGAPMPTRTEGTQPDRHPGFSRGVTQTSCHLHGGQSNKALKYSRFYPITEGSCPRKIQLNIPSKRTSLDFLP